jgi:hypothetical protein
MLSDSFRDGIDMNMGNGDGELNVTEAEEAMLMLLDELPQNPPGPDNITLNGVVGELIFVGYDIKNLASDSEDQPSIITMWDIIFHNVDANEDGQYKFAYPENPYDEGVDVPADFCAISYEYSYEIIEFVWNNTVTDLDDLGECISLNAGEVVPSFSITYAQETNNDYDNDGVNNEDDAFPYDPSETMDSDGDGWGDNADAFPNDASEKIDSDGDGVGDNADMFPSDTTEWGDTDGDGVGDNSDAFPNDASEIVDSDGDGVGNNADAFPYDSNEQSDSDGNGVGDNAQAEQEGGGDTTPVDPVPVDDGGFLPGFSAIMGIVSMLGAAILVAGRRKD